MASMPPDRLFGRDREVTVARQLVQDVAQGASATLLIEGEAGIGKTHFVRSVVGCAAEHGLTVLHGEAHALEANRPFGAVALALDLRGRSSDARRATIGRLLAGDAPGLGSTVEAHVADVRYQVVEEILDLVERMCAHTPAVMVLEDLHWADVSTLLAFRAMAHRLTHVPLLLVGTLRPTPRHPELDQLLDDSVISGAVLLRLRSLSRVDVDDLVQAQLGCPSGPVLTSIVAKAGGNPLWLVEILRSLSTEGWLRRGPACTEATADELPGSLRDLVLRRLGYLPAPALALLRTASVLGDTASVHDLAAVARRPAAEVVADLQEAFRAALLDEHHETVVFRHQLVQEAIYQDLPHAVRRAVHRDAAGVLARIGAESSRVATHLVLGADRGDMEAVGWLRQAATEAAAGAPAVAVQLLRNAQSLLPADHIDSDMVAAELAAALQRAGQVAEASAVAESVLDRPHREDVDVPIRLTLVSALSLQNRTQELIQRAETALMSPLRLVEQALVLTQASYGQTFSSDCTGGEATARRALELAERSGDTAMRVWGLGALSVPVKAQGRYAEALALARQAVDLTFDPTDEMARLRHPHFFLAMALCDSDLVDEARLTYARAIKESQDLGSAWLLPDMLLLSAELRFLVGEWDDAAAELEAGLHLAQEHGQRISLAQSLSYQAVMKLARGDQAGAGVAIASVENELSAGAPCYGAQLVAFTASALAVARAEPDRAFDLLLRCWNRDVDREVRYYHRYLAPPLVRLSLALAREDIARQVLDTVEAGAALAPEVGTVQSLALRCRGLIDNDPALMLHAVELARRGPRFLDHGSACEDAAAVLAVAGLPGHAKELLLEAQARYEAVNASGLVARVGAALRHLGVRQGTRGQRRRASTGWSSLTPSERIVSELVSEGLTNREIGGRLHISPHTVNTHLRHVFRKLSVSTRAELAGKVARSSTVGTDITHSSDVSVLPKAKTSR